MTTTLTKKKMHLLGFVQHGVINHASTMWAHPRDKVGYDFARPEYWQDLGRTMERGLFDAMFIADELAPYSTYGNSSDTTIKYAAQCPVHEPATLVPIVGCATKHLGIGITLSASFVTPYQMARHLATLDHLTNGRVGWNIVTSYSKSEFEAMGLENLIPRNKRYEVLDEYMEICYQLWNSWDEDAIIADASTGIYADPSKVHEVNFQGKHFKTKGRGFVSRSPQVKPTLWQAGSSEEGRVFASRHADSIFGIFPNVKSMRSYSDDLRSRAQTFGRNPDDVKLIYGVQIILDSTTQRAQQKYEEYKAMIRPESALAIMSGHTGFDFSTLDLDDLIADVPVQGIRGLFDAILQAHGGEPITVRQAVEMYGMSLAAPVLVGTASEVADQLEMFIDEGGCDGFMLMATVVPCCFEDIVDLLVPELQKRDRFRTSYTGTTLRQNLLQD